MDEGPTDYSYQVCHIYIYISFSLLKAVADNHSSPPPSRVIQGYRRRAQLDEKSSLRLQKGRSHFAEGPPILHQPHNSPWYESIL